MKINLDKFKTKFEVTLDGKDYEIRGVLMEEMIEDNPMDLLKEDANLKESMIAMRAIILRLSNIPEEVLNKQDMGVITTIFQLSQGITPNDSDTQKKI